MNDDTSKAMDELKDRLGLDSLRELPRADPYFILFEAEVAGHKFLAFGETAEEALAELAGKIAGGRSCEVVRLHSRAGDILNEARRRADELDAQAMDKAARVREAVAAAKRAKEAVS